MQQLINLDPNAKDTEFETILIKAIRTEMTRQKVGVSEMANLIGATTANLSAMLTRKHPITLRVIRRIGKVFGFGVTITLLTKDSVNAKNNRTVPKAKQRKNATNRKEVQR